MGTVAVPSFACMVEYGCPIDLSLLGVHHHHLTNLESKCCLFPAVFFDFEMDAAWVIRIVHDCLHGFFKYLLRCPGVGTSLMLLINKFKAAYKNMQIIIMAVQVQCSV